MLKLFKNKNKHEKPESDVKAKAKAKATEEMPQDENYVESLTPVPTVELIPAQWSRRRIIAMIRQDELGQSAKIIGGIVSFIVLVGAICVGLWMWNGFSDSNLNRQRREIGSLINQYNNSINRANGMEGIMAYTQELSIAEQARTLINICVNSGIVVHSMNMTHVTTNFPANVRNSFETTTALKLDNIKIHGIWTVDGSFTQGRTQGTNEQWILTTNKTLSSMFAGTRYNTFMDISTRAVRSQDGVNRHEFVFLFWSPMDEGRESRR